MNAKPKNASNPYITKAKTSCRGETAATEWRAMKRFTGAIVLCVSVTILPSHRAVAQDPAETTSTRPLKGKDVLSKAHWRVTGKEGHLLCEVSQMTVAKTDVSTGRTLTIYRQDNGRLAKIFALETPDAILNLYPLGDYNGRLFTTWIGGSAYHVRVFAFADGQVKEVLEEGSKVPPELLYDDKGQESVLISAPVIENGRWTSVNGTTTVFKWNGRGYDKLGTVPWLERLHCLSKESCVSSK
jgi:hypothetical protein